MNSENRSGVFGYSIDVVAWVRFISGSDLNEICPAESHHIRQAKRPADFDKLTARDDDFFAVGNGIEHNAGCGGIIIDYRSSFRTGKLL